MAIDLVDGRAGTPHIDGDDLGDFKAGFCGTGGYVLKTGDLLEATQDDANHVTVGTGSMIMPGTGRHVRVTSPEQVTVTSGTQGQSRRDLIVMRVTQKSQGSSTIEMASLVCVRGTPVSYGTPQDPAVEDGDLPLYRVSLEGATASAPVAVFDVLTPISELRDSVSQLRRVFSGSKLVTLENVGYGTVFTDEAYRSIVGRSFDLTTDFVICMNGDGDAANAPIKGTSYMPSSKTVIFSLDSARSGRMRVNYVIVAR